MLRLVIYISSGLLLASAAYLVFRVVSRHDYQQKGRLTPLSSFLELLIWGLYMSFPCIYNPPEWIWFLSPKAPVDMSLRVIGVICIVSGLILAFGTLLWFGLRRAFGLEATGLIQTGPYRVSRNPQLVGVLLLVGGAVILWPSWYAAGWIILYAVIGHLMIVTEEEYLHSKFGQVFEQYCEQVPRYIGLRRR